MTRNATNGAGVDAPKHRRAAGEPRVLWALTGLVGVVAVSLAPAIVLFLLWHAAGMKESAATLLGGTWSPRGNLFGLLPLVVGTLLTSAFALALAVPLGLGAAIFLSFYAGPKAKRLGETTLGILGGTPSVVFGLLGTAWILPLLGASLATAILVLAAMIAPTFALLARAAFQELPRGLLPAGASLGLSRSQVITGLALRTARPQLVAAASLALSRALGEALAVEMVCGNVPGIPSSISDPVRTLTTTLVQEFEYAQGAHESALHGVALAVVLLAAVASGMSIRFRTKKARA